MVSESSFIMGRLLTSRSVAEVLAIDEIFASFVSQSLQRHMAMDWTEMDMEDQLQNVQAVHSYCRIFSSYRIPVSMLLSHPKLWIITEADRSTTTVLFPEDY